MIFGPGAGGCDVTLETLAGFAIILTIAALVGALAGGWIGSRRKSGDPETHHQFITLGTLIEQAAKANREDIEGLRKALTDAERGARF